MKVSDAWRGTIKGFEGVRLTAYRDSAGVLTIGVGHTSAAGPPKVFPGMKITAREADSIFAADLAPVEKAVLQSVRIPLTQYEFEALVSLVFNIGLGAFRRSTLLRRLNANDRKGAANEFSKWIYAGGKALPGLVRRREAERAHFEDRAQPVGIMSDFHYGMVHKLDHTDGWMQQAANLLAYHFGA